MKMMFLYQQNIVGKDFVEYASENMISLYNLKFVWVLFNILDNDSISDKNMSMKRINLSHCVVSIAFSSNFCHTFT